jgi:hypothetical protein
MPIQARAACGYVDANAGVYPCWCAAAHKREEVEEGFRLPKTMDYLGMVGAYCELYLILRVGQHVTISRVVAATVIYYRQHVEM